MKAESKSQYKRLVAQGADVEPLLKPCPFCASADVTSKRNMQLDGIRFFYCHDCGAIVSFTGEPADARQFAAWARRADQQEKPDG